MRIICLFPFCLLAHPLGELFDQFGLPKVGCVFTMIIWSEFRMRKYRDGDHREDAPHFIYNTKCILLIFIRLERFASRNFGEKFNEDT